MARPWWPDSLEAYQSLTDEQLVALYDANAAQHKFKPRHVVEELARRESARHTATMVRLTWGVAVLTAVVTVATLVNVWLVWQLG